MASMYGFLTENCYETTSYTQPIEVCVDTGYKHIGFSVKSESKEYLSQQYDLLTDEKESHDAQRKYRRTRRNRLRYRKSRFDNRVHSKPKGWIAPSLKNKADRHVDLVKNICAVAPVTDVYLEVGQFDIQVLKAMQEGKPIPEGEDYQRGERYGFATLREAAFQRDHYKCQFCGRGAFDKKGKPTGLKLYAHHIYYWRKQHGDRLDEIATCCEYCHTAANHQEGGLLWGYDKKLVSYAGATFMNTVKNYIRTQLTEDKEFKIPVHTTYGAATKLSREDLGLKKSYVNDAYAMGKFHPACRAKEELYTKRRRNNRCLEKFYDAKYVDVRDGASKKGAALSCGRINRRESRRTSKNERIYRGKKISKGRRSIRKNRYTLQPGDIVQYNGRIYSVKGAQHYGEYVALQDSTKNGTSVSVKKVKPICHAGGWVRISQHERRNAHSSPSDP